MGGPVEGLWSHLLEQGGLRCRDAWLRCWGMSGLGASLWLWWPLEVTADFWMEPDPQSPFAQLRTSIPGDWPLSDGGVGCTRNWVHWTRVTSQPPRPPRFPYSSQTSVENQEPPAASAARGLAVPGLEGGRLPPAPAHAAGQPLAEPPAPRHLGVPCPRQPPGPCQPVSGGCQPAPGASRAPEGPFRQVSGAKTPRAPNRLFFSCP